MGWYLGQELSLYHIPVSRFQFAHLPGRKSCVVRVVLISGQFGCSPVDSCPGSRGLVKKHLEIVSLGPGKRPDGGVSRWYVGLLVLAH